MLVVPVVSYLLGALTVQVAVDQNWPVPYQLMGYPALPSLLSRSVALLPVVNFLEEQQNLYAILLMTFLFIIAIGAALSFVYALIYQYVGPPRYGPLDAPPPKIAVKQYKR
jgi:hypothetical protein